MNVVLIIVVLIIVVLVLVKKIIKMTVAVVVVRSGLLQSPLSSCDTLTYEVRSGGDS
jgi:hypothetical protein